MRLLADNEPVEITGKGRVSGKNKRDHQASALLKFAEAQHTFEKALLRCTVT